MMGKNLSSVSNTIFDRRVVDPVRVSVDFSKFESTPDAECVEHLCRGILLDLIHACPWAFESKILGPDLVEFLV